MTFDVGMPMVPELALFVLAVLVLFIGLVRQGDSASSRVVGWVTLAGLLFWQGVMLKILGNGGTIPINTSGGLLSCYHLGDLTGLAESVRQIRGDAGQRQVKDCEFVMTTGHGGELVSPGMCSIHTCTILGKNP